MEEARLFIIINRKWLIDDNVASKRLKEGCVCVDRNIGFLRPGCRLQIRYHDPENPNDPIRNDPDGTIVEQEEKYYIKSKSLADLVGRQFHERQFIVLYIEGTAESALGMVLKDGDRFVNLLEDRVGIERLKTFDIPPVRITLLEEPGPTENSYSDPTTVYSVSRSIALESDPVLLGTSGNEFLKSPHIIQAMLAHIANVEAKEAVRFPTQVTILAAQLRESLQHESSVVRIEKVQRSHMDLWRKAERKKFTFVDGGETRILSIAGSYPMGLRVGIY